MHSDTVKSKSSTVSRRILQMYCPKNLGPSNGRVWTCIAGVGSSKKPVLRVQWSLHWHFFSDLNPLMCFATFFQEQKTRTSLTQQIQGCHIWSRDQSHGKSSESFANVKQLPSWWFQAVWKLLVTLDFYPQIGVNMNNIQTHRLSSWSCH